jgi:hypothetical protein
MGEGEQPRIGQEGGPVGYVSPTAKEAVALIQGVSLTARPAGEQVQADLAVVKTRDALIGCRTKLVNQARSLVKSFGYRLPKCDAEYFWKNTAPHVPEALKPALRPVYKTLAQLSEQIKNCDRELQRVGKRYPDVEVVGQPCGVGLLTALTFLLTIEHTGSTISIELRDRGPEFDPTQVSAPARDENEDDRPPGGFGIHLVRRYADEVLYRREGAENVLRLTKRLDPPARPG